MVKLQPQFLARCVPRTTVIVILTRRLHSTFRYISFLPTPPSSPLTFLCSPSLSAAMGWSDCSFYCGYCTDNSMPPLPPPPHLSTCFFLSLSLSFWSWCWKNSSTPGRGLLCVLRSNKSPTTGTQIPNMALTDRLPVLQYTSTPHKHLFPVFFDLLSGCFHRNLLHDDAFVDEVRVSIRHAASVVLRRAQQVLHNSLDCFIKFFL